jgi:opacity protein-like surface antigen
MRKAFVAALAALAGMGVSAHAADIYEGSLKDEPVAYAPAPVWSGLYIGGHVGGLWNDSGDTSAFYKRWNRCKGKGECYGDWEPSKKAKFEDDDDNLSLLGGVHIGYNWQNGTRVYGLEGDVSFSDGVDYLASLRARLGHAWDDTLIYATAGVAFAGFEDKSINVNWFKDHHEVEFSGDNKIGFVVGGGIERKLSSNVSVGLEGLYYFFDDSNMSKEEWMDWFCAKFEHEEDNDLFVVRARLSYHLQRDEPSLDSYK